MSGERQLYQQRPLAKGLAFLGTFSEFVRIYSRLCSCSQNEHLHTIDLQMILLQTIVYIVLTNKMRGVIMTNGGGNHDNQEPEPKKPKGSDPKTGESSSKQSC